MSIRTEIESDLSPETAEASRRGFPCADLKTALRVLGIPSRYFPQLLDLAAQPTYEAALKLVDERLQSIAPNSFEGCAAAIARFLTEQRAVASHRIAAAADLGIAA